MKIQKIKEQSAAPAHCFEYVGSFSENKQKIIEETRQPHIRILDVWERERANRSNMLRTISHSILMNKALRMRMFIISYGGWTTNKKKKKGKNVGFKSWQSAS